MIYALDSQTPILGQGAWVADTARVVGRVTLGDQASVWFGAVVRGDNEPINIGARSNVQDNAVLHSDWDFPLTIGEDCTIGHGAIVHGCTIGHGVLVGMGAIILNGAKIGDGCLIGAGALVTEGKEIAPGSLVVGSPAKVIRELDAAARDKLLLSAENYAKNAARFAEGLRPVDR
jgi:carbonic anhydrase/acetyltransferase-like protein (isoleucine patch superfamily)